MSKQLYTIESRYQRWSRDGIIWTDWFNTLTDGHTDDLSFLEDRISIYKKRDKESKEKLKHEYRIVEWIEPIIEEKPKKCKNAARASKKSK